MTYPRLFRARAGLTALLALAACTDANPTDPRAAPPAAGEPVTTALNCDVDLARNALRCAESAPAGGGGASYAIMLGKQGTYMRLSSSGMAYDAADSIFSMEVTVQSLISQQMGTPDGVTVAGLKVFFYELPVATAGSGPVAVANPDGYATFTTAGQPYFAYPEIVEPRGITAPRAWRFKVPPAVTHFRFSVLVETTLPAEAAALRWRTVQGAGYIYWAPFHWGVWAGSATDIFAAGGNGVMHFDGNSWFPMTLEGQEPGYEEVVDIVGTSRTRLYALSRSGEVWKYDGMRWKPRRIPQRITGYSGYFEAAWASGDTVYAVGERSNSRTGIVAKSFDGGLSWTASYPASSTGTRTLTEIGAHGADLYAVGHDEGTTTAPGAGVILHSRDGGVTWTETRHRSATTHPHYNAVWVEAGKVVVGGSRNGTGFLAESGDGGATWTTTVIAPGSYRAVSEIWRSPGGTLYAAGHSTFLVHDGQTWQERPGPAPGMPWVNGMHGAGGVLYAVGFTSIESLLSYNEAAGTWTWNQLTSGSASRLHAVWGAGATNVYAVGTRTRAGGVSQSVLYSRFGSVWSWNRRLAVDSMEMRDIWGSGPSDIYVVGRRILPAGNTGVIWRYDGTSWTTREMPFSGPSRLFTAVWGSGRSDVYVFGRQSGATGGEDIVILHSTDSGANWKTTVLPGVPGERAIIADAWGSGPDNVYAVGYRHLPPPARLRSLVLRFNGAAWTSVSAEDTTQLTGVWGSGADNVFVTGRTSIFYREPDDDFDYPVVGNESGVIRRSTDGGKTWQQQVFTDPGGVGRGLFAVWGWGRSSVVAVGERSVMYFDGTRWSDQGSTGWPRLRGVWGSSPHDVMAVGDRGTIVQGTR